MSVGGGPSPARSRGVAGRGRSLRRPAPAPRPADPPPTEPDSPGGTGPTPADQGGHGFLHRLLVWPGWTNIAAVITTIAVVSALWFTSQTLLAAQSQNTTARQLAITDRFQKATEMLTSDKVNSRVTAIYMLEKIAQDSPQEQPLVVAAITAFLRQQSKLQRDQSGTSECPNRYGSWTDVDDFRAALEVLDRRDTNYDLTISTRAVDLTGVCFRGMAINGYTGGLSGVTFAFADLRNTSFFSMNIGSAFFFGADLRNAAFADSDPSDATFTFADLSGATIKTAANLTITPEDQIYYDNTTVWPAGYTPPPSRPNRCVDKIVTPYAC